VCERERKGERERVRAARERVSRVREVWRGGESEERKREEKILNIKVFSSPLAFFRMAIFPFFFSFLFSKIGIRRITFP